MYPKPSVNDCSIEETPLLLATSLGTSADARFQTMANTHTVAETVKGAGVSAGGKDTGADKSVN